MYKLNNEHYRGCERVIEEYIGTLRQDLHQTHFVLQKYLYAHIIKTVDKNKKPKGNNLMKKIVKTKTIVQDIVTYESVDGKEFETENACREWERSYKGVLAASWNNYHKVGVCSSAVGLPWNNDDWECYLVVPKSMEEIIFLNAYCKMVVGANVSRDFNMDDIGRSLILDFGYDRDYCDIYDTETHIASLIKNINDYKDKYNKGE